MVEHINFLFLIKYILFCLLFSSTETSGEEDVNEHPIYKHYTVK